MLPIRIRIFSPGYNVGKTAMDLIEDYINVQKILIGMKCKIELLLIDDNSVDNTLEIFKQAAKKHKWITVKHNKKRMFNAANIIRGYKWGAKSKCDIIICMDFDGEHSPYAIPRHLRMIQRGECDGVVGSIIFPDHHIDRRAIEKTLLEINSLSEQGNEEMVKHFLSILEKINQFGEELISADGFLDRNMMRYWGRMQSTIAGIDGTFYIQSPGYNIHQRYRVEEALKLFKEYKRFFYGESFPGLVGEALTNKIKKVEGTDKDPFPRWGMHGVMIHLIAVGTGAHIKAAYLECFGTSPNRTAEKLLQQSEAAGINTTRLGRFLPGPKIK